MCLALPYVCMCGISYLRVGEEPKRVVLSKVIEMKFSPERHEINFNLHMFLLWMNLSLHTILTIYCDKRWLD